MRLLILTQYYPPEVGAPQNRLSDFAQRLVAMGHQVTVVTAMPNYPTGFVFDGWRRKLVAKEEIAGVEVLRSWIAGPGQGSTVKQLFSYGTFLLTAALTAPFRIQAVDVVLWESPPLFLSPTATLLARRFKAKLVMNVSDLWPASAIDLGMLRSKQLQRFFKWWERRSYLASDLVLGQTEHIVEEVGAIAGRTPVALFPNGVDVDVFRPMPRDVSQLEGLGIAEDARIVAYVGTFGRAQALEQIVGAAERLRQHEGLVFLLVGDGPRSREIQELVRRKGLTNVVYSPPFPKSLMPSILSMVDIALVPLADRPVFEGARPSKMFELFASGVPTIFCGRGEGAELAKAAGASVVPPEEPGALALEVARLLGVPRDGLRSVARQERDFVTTHYDRRRIAVEIEGRLLRLVEAR